MSFNFPYGPTEMRHGRLLDSVVYLTFVGFFVWYVSTTMYGKLPADMSALYYAATFAAEGRPELIYWENWSLQPVEWQEAVAGDGYKSDNFYAYIYPPIWAYVLAPLASWLEPRAFFNLFTILHMLLFCTTTRMAYLMIAGHTWLSLWAIPVLLIMLSTMFGASLIGQVQPSAIMYFLIVWGFKRLVDGKHKRAGVYLALAATIKIFPVILGVIFLTKRFRSGMKPFVITGLTLVMLSFALLPFDLHREFLSMGAELSSMTMLAYLNLNLESFLTRILLLLGGVEQIGLFSIEDNQWVWGINAVITFVFAVWLYRAARFESMLYLRRRFVPLAILGMTLIAPIGWAHYFAATLCFLPVVFFLIPHHLAMFAVMAIVIVNFPATYQVLNVPFYPILGTLSMIGLGAIIAFAKPALDLTE